MDVLISIRPQHIQNICEVIGESNGKQLYKKTIEVRKSKPKLKIPFKCLIYCTNDRKVFLDSDCNNKFWTEKNYGGKHYYNGKVIGEFVCDRIDEYDYDQAFDESMGIFIDKFGYSITSEELKQTCLSYEELEKYGNTDRLYGWHISDLKIYDKPKELGEFFHYCGDNPKCDGCEAHYYSNTECGKEDYCCSIIEGCKPLKRAFQSWGYIES